MAKRPAPSVVVSDESPPRVAAMRVAFTFAPSSGMGGEFAATVPSMVPVWSCESATPRIMPTKKAKAKISRQPDLCQRCLIGMLDQSYARDLESALNFPHLSNSTLVGWSSRSPMC